VLWCHGCVTLSMSVDSIARSSIRGGCGGVKLSRGE
jgi:hypothetical protein